MTNDIGQNDFDFLLDTWQVRNRRKNVNVLTDDPQSSQAAPWDEFPGTAGGAIKKLDGRIVIDHYDFTFGSGLHVLGITVRVFDPTTSLWSIGWFDTRQPPDFRPLVGKFQDGVGEFFQVINDGQDRPLHILYKWDNITPASARWQQAFSWDAGQSWDTNWIMELSR